MKTRIINGLIISILLLITIITNGQEQLNSIIGFKIGMSKEDAILRLSELKTEFKEYPQNSEINLRYDIFQDTKEMNFIRLFFKNDKLVQIWVYFYKFNMINRAQTSTRFKDYLDELDKIYNNDINWKGKWKSKDGSLIVKTSTDVMLDEAFDVLIIQAN